jgi:murein L,D-transpeptidase YcbB/YkuD
VNGLLRALLLAMLGMAASVAGAAPAISEQDIAAAVDRLYGGTPPPRLWTAPGGLTAAGRAALAELMGADARGLRAADYDAAVLGQRADALRSAGAAPEVITAFERDLSQALARYIVHLRRGRVRPQDAGYQLDVQRDPLDLAAALRAYVSSASPAAVLDGFEPRYRHYPLLKAALARYRQLSQLSPRIVLAPLPRRSVKPGEAYADAAALRQLLVRLGDLRETDLRVADAGVLDAVLAAGLARFQQRLGLTADGVLGASTWRALNLPLDVRIHQIELAMERARWLPPPPGGPFILVNIPQFRLFAFRGPEDREQAMTAMNVIVGRSFPQTHTPVFTADMRFIVFRPYWDVPASIVHKEVLPQLRRNLAVAEKEGYELVRGQSDASPVVAMTPEGLDALERGELRIRQRAGAKNALGAVKFMLPNPYNVYLHSTPAQRLFGQSLRAFSHGCIRIEDPVAFAQFVFADDPAWTRERIVEAMRDEAPMQRIYLKAPIPVVVFYATAIAAEDGRVLFFEDLYRHDRRLDALLAAARPGRLAGS